MTATRLDINYQTPSIKDDTTTVSSGDTSSRITAAIIPRDILLLIFYNVIHQHDAGIAVFNSAIPTTSYLSSASPIPLTHVCAHWRDVAINSSQLWSDICIDHPRESHIELTKIWLERSRTHPLRLTIKTSSYLTVNPTSFTRILLLFISKIHQWKEIDFDLPLNIVQDFSKMLAEAKMHLWHLESATFSVHSQHRPFKIRDSTDHTTSVLSLDTIWQSLHSSISLKSVNWKNLYEGRSPPAHTPWSSLTRLDLDYFVGIAEIIHILSMSPNMQIFRAEGSPKVSSERGPISFANPLIHGLRTLCLTTTEAAGDFFVNVVLPQLRKLHITYQVTPHRSSEGNQDNNTSWSLAEKFRHFLSQSKCHLEDVWLKTPPYSDSDLRSHLCSTAFQSVNRLRITGSNLVTDDVIGAMTLEGRDVGILMDLKRLWLDFEETEITDGLVSTMVASRWLLPMDQRRKGVLVPRLEEVRLTRDFLDSFESVDREKLSFMLAKGLRVSISPGTLDSV